MRTSTRDEGTAGNSRRDGKRIRSNHPNQFAIDNSQFAITGQLRTANCELLWGGWNITQPNTEQGIESDFSPQKTETNPTAILRMDESLLSINTQTAESDDVPTTSQNLYETGGGWNSSLSQTGKVIEGDFRGGKLELTNLKIQDCLKQLRQVKTADDYWRIYERSSQLVEEAWKLLNPGEQLRIQQICDEGVDPLAKWKEGERVWLWHPFAEKKWGLATVKQVMPGACGFVYVLRDDGFGLHLGRERLNLMVLT